jgi:GNAT superfamily N-acetyltransferase
MDITLQKSNPLHKQHREALYPLFDVVFGIPAFMLKDYHNRGFWNPDYCPYTLFKKNCAVANVSVIPMQWIIDRELVTAAGIQSVMTHPAERGNGYMKKLMNTVLEDLKNTSSLIFLQTENPALYEKYGFEKVEEHIFISEAYQNPSLKNSLLRKMDFTLEEDAEVIRSCFAEQRPNSRIFSPVHYEHSLFLNLYNPYFSEKTFYSVTLKALIVYEVQDKILKLYDVVGKSAINLADICNVIPEVFHRLEIYFTPDQLIPTHSLETKKKQGTLMVKGKLPVAKQPIAFPFTASF